MLRVYLVSNQTPSGRDIQTRNTALDGRHARVVETLLEFDENDAVGAAEWNELRANHVSGNGTWIGLFHEDGTQWA